jgi:small GTP-binding protein
LATQKLLTSAESAIVGVGRVCFGLLHHNANNGKECQRTTRCEVAKVYSPEQKAMSHDYLFKFIVVGNSASGKSCLVQQFCSHQFQPVHEHTIGVEFAARIIDVGQHVAKLQIWDTAGAEVYYSITKCYYRTAAAVILVYDITNRASFDKIPWWLEQVHEQCGAHVPIVLLGNKLDLEHRRAVPTAEGQSFATAAGIMFSEVSARSGVGVDHAFRRLAQTVYQKLLHDAPQPSTIVLDLEEGEEDSQRRSACCGVERTAHCGI